MKNIIKVITIALTSLAVFFTIFSYREIKDFISVFKWNMAFSAWKFIDAQSEYIGISELGLSENNQNVLDFNTANTFYADKNFSWALMFYSEVKDLNSDITYLKFHNIWNSLYRLWLLQDENIRLTSWQKSVWAFEIALKSKSSKDKKDTLANYEFVKKELEKLKKKLQEKQEEEQKKQEQKESNKENSSTWKESKWGEQEKPKESEIKPDDKKTWDKEQNTEDEQKSWTTKWSFNQLWQNWAENTEKLSPEEKKELEDYSKYLKQFQRDNLWNVQKWASDSQNSLNNIYNNLLQNPSFNDFNPNVDKDW